MQSLMRIDPVEIQTHIIVISKLAQTICYTNHHLLSHFSSPRIYSIQKLI